MPSVVQLIRSRSLAETSYAYAATAPADARLVFLAGACPLNDDGTTAAVGDFSEQAAVCVDTLRRALAEAGAGLTDVLNTRVLVASSRREDLVDVMSQDIGDICVSGHR